MIERSSAFSTPKVKPSKTDVHLLLSLQLRFAMGILKEIEKKLFPQANNIEEILSSFSLFVDKCVSPGTSLKSLMNIVYKFLFVKSFIYC